ncbi:NmrA/HSCARG family protein [Streptomyces griseorubiginosus]|uniref:NmrA/HSCARG family protein n=1 Tax=Streptomyces griseorubiginosus TaxID=67304 RepID=UPI001AD72364|nr:NmrA/HSCARG family protein [Streptomyces griseorubiginosus]MBO4252335.1 NmrA family NAD(P)-binding protein [Streptomyces griseorubiginosus]
MTTADGSPNAVAEPRKLFTVVGATGQQGGATASALLDAGARVRATVRDPLSDRARRLADRGAELVQAGIEDHEALRAAFTGVDGVYAMTTMMGPGGTEREIELGLALGDAARDAEVPHLVFSSVGGAERNTGVPHFESKGRIEEHLRKLGLNTTILRPTLFMDNFAAPGGSPQEEDGVLVLRMPLPGDVPLQLIAVADIGAIAATALLDPKTTEGRAIEIAGDELTAEQIVATLGAAAGKPGRFEPLPLDVLGDNADMRAMFAWFGKTPAYEADFAATRELHPEVRDFATWASEHFSSK